jgi:hypothetical protein
MTAIWILIRLCHPGDTSICSIDPTSMQFMQSACGYFDAETTPVIAVYSFFHVFSSLRSSDHSLGFMSQPRLGNKSGIAFIMFMIIPIV